MEDQILRRHLVNLLQGRGAHMPFDDAVADFPPAMINTRPPNVTYTPWHLVEHLRLAQWDILEYVRNPQHVSPPWPEGYWPAPDAQADVAAWNASLDAFRRDLRDMQAIVEAPATDLLAPIPHGYDGHTILREALILADHNAYHVGELAILRQVMGAWGKAQR
ncbi:MAG: DinB family protein [Anaerolineae bacterium]|nr:DinB family protein [Anaerolineae bacterium]